MTTTRRTLGTGPQPEQARPEDVRQEERLLPAERAAVERSEGTEEAAQHPVRSGRRPLGHRG
ncbi:MAG TPA: hypothetical protein VFY14_15505 [Streptomyces sp.]|nr:hypothetical protein [Streptomyces sp.]